MVTMNLAMSSADHPPFFMAAPRMCRRQTLSAPVWHYPTTLRNCLQPTRGGRGGGTGRQSVGVAATQLGGSIALRRLNQWRIDDGRGTPCIL